MKISSYPVRSSYSQLTKTERAIAELKAEFPGAQEVRDTLVMEREQALEARESRDQSNIWGKALKYAGVTAALTGASLLGPVGLAVPTVLGGATMVKFIVDSDREMGPRAAQSAVGLFMVAAGMAIGAGVMIAAAVPAVAGLAYGAAVGTAVAGGYTLVAGTAGYLIGKADANAKNLKADAYLENEELLQALKQDKEWLLAAKAG